MSPPAGFPRPLSIPCLVLVVLISWSARADAQCPEEPPLQNYTGGGTVVCPCFAPGERAGVVLEAPAGDYPLEILRFGVGWGSQLGGTGQSLEQAIQIYEGGLPTPGPKIFDLPGPQLTDGVINEFNLEPIAGEIVIDAGPFLAALEFMNRNNDSLFDPSVVHDGNGCQSGKNAVYAIPGGWANACALGVTGDWVMYVIYRPCATQVGVGDERMVANAPAVLLPAQPNPFRASTDLEFYLREPGRARITIHDVAGRRVATLADGEYGDGLHRLSWNGNHEDGRPARAGVYFVSLDAGEHRSRVKVVLTR